MLIFCPSCQRQLRVPDQAARKTVQCPSCQTTFVAGDTPDDEQIQAPVAARPTIPQSAPEAFDEEPRTGRRRWEADDDLRVRGGGEEAQHRANATSLWLWCAALVTLIVIVANMVLTVAQGAMEDGPFGGALLDEDLVAGMACVGGCGVTVLAANILIIIGAVQLRSLASKGWVINAIVMAFGQTLLFGGGVLINMIYLAADPDDALAHWAPLTMMLSGGAAFLNCFAGVKGILTLNHAGVDAAFEENRHTRRRRKTRWEE